jgi:hypothetical protein
MLYNNAAMSDFGQGYWECREVGGTHTRDAGEEDKDLSLHTLRVLARFLLPELQTKPKQRI